MFLSQIATVLVAISCMVHAYPTSREWTRLPPRNEKPSLLSRRDVAEELNNALTIDSLLNEILNNVVPTVPTDSSLSDEILNLVGNFNLGDDDDSTAIATAVTATSITTIDELVSSLINAEVSALAMATSTDATATNLNGVLDSLSAVISYLVDLLGP